MDLRAYTPHGLSKVRFRPPSLSIADSTIIGGPFLDLKSFVFQAWKRQTRRRRKEEEIGDWKRQKTKTPETSTMKMK